MGDKVLITGVPGWLGNRFLEVSSEKHAFDEVRCLALRGTDSSTLSQLGADEIVEADIRDYDGLKLAVKDIDTVFHLAGIIHPRKIKDLFEVNTRGTENLIRVCIKERIRKFIFISSNSAAGTSYTLMTERDRNNPYMAYGKSKHLAEQTILNHSKYIDTVILRPCWYYGPGQPERQTKLFKMIKGGRPIIFGDGNNLRSMTYLDNLIQAMLLAHKKNVESGELFWIADEHPYTTNEIYKTVADLLGVENFKPRHLPSMTSTICRKVDSLMQKLGHYVMSIHVAGEMTENIACSIEKAKQRLGYEPQISLKEGMKRSIDWCREHGIDI